MYQIVLSRTTKLHLYMFCPLKSAGPELRPIHSEPNVAHCGPETLLRYRKDRRRDDARLVQAKSATRGKEHAARASATCILDSFISFERLWCSSYSCMCVCVVLMQFRLHSSVLVRVELELHELVIHRGFCSRYQNRGDSRPPWLKFVWLGHTGALLASARFPPTTASP